MKQIIASILIATATTQAQQSFWPKDMQVMFEGREYELSATDERKLICRVHKYMGGHMYEVELPRKFNWVGGGGTVRGTRQGEPVYQYETDPKKRIILNISTWASIRELHVDSRMTREKRETYAHKENWESIDRTYGSASWK
jgi:hypothetical protein